MSGKIVSINHYDLDAAGCRILLNHIFSRNGFDKEFNMGYTKLEKVIGKHGENLIENYDAVICTDVGLRVEQFTGLQKAFGDKFIYIDHHKSSEEIPYYATKSKALVDLSKCATKIIYDDFMGANAPEKFADLVDIVDVYDLWQTDSNLWGKAYGLNVLFWKYHMNQFVNRFCNGFTGFNGYEKKVIKESIADVRKNMEKAEQTTFGDNSVIFTGLTSEHINDTTLAYPHFNLFYIITVWDEKFNVSVRARGLDDLNRFDMNRDLDDLNVVFPETVVNAGGHPMAGGISFGDLATFDDILEVIENLNGKLEGQIKNDWIEEDVPF
jgi:oligoribonuclease NrnB/cAMP/cGMP phosphodiesterase (DHH superfamily)